MKRILMIIGSLRSDSFNKQLADVVTEMMAGIAEVSVLEYSDLPLMNQDMEYPAPEAVSRVRHAVNAADGIWIFSPEYIYQIPGVLKNLLDWLSRPMDPNDRNRDTVVVKGKYVTISSVAGGSSGAG
ncbi:MAG: NAD(P)H-dependent oxidoreductase, partial [Firmicutes bacterium]|nr:NAD(P)H-dependent oxidoreductase [Bacillota bacterium]